MNHTIFKEIDNDAYKLAYPYLKNFFDGTTPLMGISNDGDLKIIVDRNGYGFELYKDDPYFGQDQFTYVSGYVESSDVDQDMIDLAEKNLKDLENKSFEERFNFFDNYYSDLIHIESPRIHNKSSLSYDEQKLRILANFLVLGYRTSLDYKSGFVFGEEWIRDKNSLDDFLKKLSKEWMPILGIVNLVTNLKVTVDRS